MAHNRERRDMMAGKARDKEHNNQPSTGAGNAR
jgi:hypothetical protein